MVFERMFQSVVLVTALSVVPQPPPPEAAYLTVGLFIGQIEEGARIFTPTRLLPFDHPESLGHQFPAALKS